MTIAPDRKTILIVDDTPEHIEILVQCLRLEYATKVALDGENALQLANTDPIPDLILLDVVMPGAMDGYEVCARLKASEKTRDIPVIFTTALGGAQDESHGFALGAVDYISKPFNSTLVKARIKTHIELKSYRDSLEVQVRERTRELALTQDATIYGLGILAEFRDTETGMHIKRTQTYVGLLARHLQNNPKFRGFFDESTIRLLVNSAPLHDIGKVGVPDNILRKPGPLTTEEFAQIKKHTTFGRGVVDRIEAGMHDKTASGFLHFAKEVTYTHHECWNGNGYHGLKGEEIPVSGRLMAVADIYDALTSKRVYKAALSHEEAFRIITEGDGRTLPVHFDPEVLQAFIDIGEDFRVVSEKWRD
ncbi:MAG: HD domain-containing phosphohydrolase [Sulfuricellaceae bacterium]